MRNVVDKLEQSLVTLCLYYIYYVHDRTTKITILFVQNNYLHTVEFDIDDRKSHPVKLSTDYTICSLY